MLRYFTAGETHGKCLTVIIEGMPSGVEISLDDKRTACKASAGLWQRRTNED